MVIDLFLGERLILEQTRSRTVVDKCKTFRPRRSSSVTKGFDHKGLRQLQNFFVTDEDLCGRNVVHLSTTVLLRVWSRINRSPYLLCSNEPLWHQIYILLFHFPWHSFTEDVYCDNYVVKFAAGEQADYLIKNVSTVPELSVCILTYIICAYTICTLNDVIPALWLTYRKKFQFHIKVKS